MICHYVSSRAAECPKFSLLWMMFANSGHSGSICQRMMVQVNPTSHARAIAGCLSAKRARLSLPFSSAITRESSVATAPSFTHRNAAVVCPHASEIMRIASGEIGGKSPADCSQSWTLDFKCRCPSLLSRGASSSARAPWTSLHDHPPATSMPNSSWTSAGIRPCPARLSLCTPQHSGGICIL